MARKITQDMIMSKLGAIQIVLILPLGAGISVQLMSLCLNRTIMGGGSATSKTLRWP